MAMPGNGSAESDNFTPVPAPLANIPEKPSRWIKLSYPSSKGRADADADAVTANILRLKVGDTLEKAKATHLPSVSGPTSF